MRDEIERRPSIGVFHYDRYPVDVGTKVIDFSILTGYSDPVIANACIRVLTSDGQFGSLSHLTVFHNPERFTADLAARLGKTNVPTILNGGDGDWMPSRILRVRLWDSLTKAGFILSNQSQHEDTLGKFSRGATLMSDKVLVSRVPFGTTIPEEITLSFPKTN